MEDHSIPAFNFLIAFILLISDCAAKDIIYANQEIRDGKTIVSKDEMFELGFFSPQNSKKRYLGIWYKKISSGMFKVSSNGNLLILSGDNTMVWSSKSTVSVQRNNPVVVAQLLDTGNLVVRDKNNTNKIPIWQSFDYPGDTFLPGMKFGKDLVTGLERCTTSWKSPNDPSMGVYSNRIDTNGYPQVFGWQDQVLVSRLGPWNGISFSGFPVEKSNPIYSYEFVVNEKEIYYKYELRGLVVQRVVLTWDGKTQMLHWIERTKDWIVYGDLKVDSCDRFALCGPYGICSINKHPPCNCMQGFKPRNPKE